MFKILFWVLVALVIASLTPDTIVKAMLVYWVVLVVGWIGYRLFFGWCWKRGKVTIVHTATPGLSAQDIKTIESNQGLHDK